jgi:nitrous oxidase accessory protein NosD
MLRPGPRSWIAAAIVIACAAAFALTTSTASSSADETCTKVAAPNGSDSAEGSVTHPYRTVQHLVYELDPGQTGCLRAGTYGGDDVYLNKPETTLESYPGEQATVTAFIEITSEAPRSAIAGLMINGENSDNAVTVKLQSDEAVLRNNIITKGGQGICVLAGTYYPASNVLIEGNRIYNCGASTYPDGSPDKFDHLIYLSGTQGAIVRWNILTDNGGGWGVHMYPHADGTVVEHNIIDGNQGGVIFAGAPDDGSPSDNNTVRRNAITGSGPRWNIESSWSGGPAGVGNVATENCVYSNGPSAPSGISSGSGFSATNNTVLGGSPYLDAAAGDYHFKSGSPCAELVGDVADVVAGTVSATEATSVAPAEPTPTASDGEPVEITIKAGSNQIAPKRPVRVKGRLISPRHKTVKAHHVAVQVKLPRDGWKTVRHRAVHHGRFSATIGPGRVGGSRIARLRVVIPGRAHSRVVRVRISRAN